MDLLLDLARRQKLDLGPISILSLVDQYLAIVAGAQQVRLELAADWLVMAAWLTWLKSRLLLPPSEDEGEGELAAETLAARLHEMEGLRAAAAWLSAQPQLGRDVFARGAPERLESFDRSRLAADLPGLLRGYLGAVRRAAGQRTYRPGRAAERPTYGRTARSAPSCCARDDRPARRRAPGRGPAVRQRRAGARGPGCPPAAA